MLPSESFPGMAGAPSLHRSVPLTTAGRCVASPGSPIPPIAPASLPQCPQHLDTILANDRILASQESCFGLVMAPLSATNARGGKEQPGPLELRPTVICFERAAAL